MYKELFRMPNPVKILGRSSSITNAFINGIIPCIVPTEEEIETVLTILGMDQETVCCAYCGDTMTEWDHFYPLIKDKKATGYISEINNLVPCCGKCNQSKGNKYWKDWMLSAARLAPANRGIHDLDIRIQRLVAYEEWSRPQKIDFEKMVGLEKWQAYWAAYETLMQNMREVQLLSDEIKLLVKSELS